MRVDHWEELHRSELRGVGLAVHQSLDHLDYLLAQIFHVYQRENIFNAVRSGDTCFPAGNLNFEGRSGRQSKTVNTVET